MKLDTLSFQELRLVVDLAQAGSLREIARKRSVNPSQISRTLKGIESKLGASLLKRSVSGIVFTPDGEQFRRTAIKILGLTDDLRSGKSETTPALSKPIRIGSFSYLNNHILPECLAALRKHGHEGRYTLFEIPGEELVSLGLKNTFDVALHVGKLTWTKSWHTQRIGSFPSALYARSGHFLGTSTSVTELKEFPFVIPVRNAGGKSFTGNDGCPIALQQRVHGDFASTADAALELVRTSDQLAYLPTVVAKRAVANQEVAEVFVKDWKPSFEDLYLSAHAESVSSTLFKALVNELKKRI